METKNKDQIIEFYKSIQRKPGWGRLRPILIFLPQLFQERELAGCTFSTSHETLGIHRYPCPEWNNKPSISINSASEGLTIKLTITLSTEPVSRVMTESVSCKVEDGIREFDRMYKAFLLAHDVKPQGLTVNDA